VSVPEATVNENDLVSRRKHYVGISWQIAPIQAKPVAQRMKKTADE
jgi:hypothetical protein